MERNYKAEIEAILFTMGESVDINKIANALEIKPSEVKKIVKEMQKDPFRKIIQIDFKSIRKGEIVKLKIPVIFYGQEALEAKGLLLESFVNEVELQGEVGKFPDNISIDVSKLEEGNQILVRDLPISKDMVIEGNVDLAVAKISYRTNNVSEDESEE